MPGEIPEGFLAPELPEEPQLCSPGEIGADMLAHYAKKLGNWNRPSSARFLRFSSPAAGKGARGHRRTKSAAGGGRHLAFTEQRITFRTVIASVPFSILVVEHSEVLSAPLCRYLRSRGHAVQLAVDFSSAQAALAAQSFDVLITDVLLPDGDGRMLIDEAPANLPRFVLTMSAYDAADLRVSDRPTDRRRHLHKPFVTEELDAALAAFASTLEHST